MFSITTKMAMVFASFGGVLVTVFILVVQIWIKPQIENNIKSRLKDMVVVAANMINVPDHQKILSMNLDAGSKEYVQNRAVLLNVAKSFPDIESMYTFVPTQDSDVLAFVLDSSDSTDKNKNGVIEAGEQAAGIGEKYKIGDEKDLRDGINGTTVNEKPFTDKWGTFISAYSPIRDVEGKSVGLVGADMRYEKYQSLINDFLIRSIGIFLALFALCVLLGYFFGRQFSNQIKKMNLSVAKIREVNSEEYIEEVGNDEITELVRSINLMVREWREAKSSMVGDIDGKTKLLEDKVKELEKMNRLMVGREIAMAELKKSLVK